MMNFKFKLNRYERSKSGDLFANIIISFAFVFIIGFGLMVILQRDADKRTSPEKSISQQLYEVYLVETGRRLNAFYTLTADKSSLGQGEQVQVEVSLTTTGEPFDLACAAVVWDPEKLRFVSAKPTELPGEEQALDVFVGEENGKRMVCLYVPRADKDGQSMMTIDYTPASVYTLVFESLVDKPNTVVSLSPAAGDLAVHFTGSSVVNSVNQSLIEAVHTLAVIE